MPLPESLYLNKKHFSFGSVVNTYTAFSVNFRELDIMFLVILSSFSISVEIKGRLPLESLYQALFCLNAGSISSQMPARNSLRFISTASPLVKKLASAIVISSMPLRALSACQFRFLYCPALFLFLSLRQL